MVKVLMEFEAGYVLLRVFCLASVILLVINTQVQQVIQVTNTIILYTYLLNHVCA